MKIAFVGKGGSGKTTLSSLFARYLAGRGLPVVAIDADINQHLAAGLGMDDEDAARIPALGAHLTELKDLLRGTNPLIASAQTMVKTTPPGRGSRLLTVLGDNPVHERYAVEHDGLRIMATGPFDEADLGVSCYHSKVGAVEMYLNHLVDLPGEYVVVDMTAGADSFASGMFTRFDMTFLVAEPTRKGVGVYRQYKEYAADFDVHLRVVGNKIQGPDDVEFLREHVGDDLLVCLEQSSFVRAMEKGRALAFDALEEGNLTALGVLRETVDNVPKDWGRFHRQTVEFHLRNATGWANKATGVDLSTQVDPEFMLSPKALAR